MGFNVRASPGNSGLEGLQPERQDGPSASSRLNLGLLKGQRAEFGVREETPGRNGP